MKFFKKSIIFSLILYLSLSSNIIQKKDVKAVFSNNILNKNQQFNIYKKTSLDIPKYVVLGGEPIGVKIYTDGLLVVFLSEVYDENGISHPIAKNSGIMTKDRILSVDGIKLYTNEELSDYINKKKSEITLKIARDDKILIKKITPVKSKDDGMYKIGIWVRDSAAGIGTITYYDTENNSFGALGHAICDSDTLDILKLSDGSLTKCDVISVRKSEDGKPGELKGRFWGNDIGKITVNNELGIYGKLNADAVFSDKQKIQTATRFEVKQGSAKILCCIDNNGVCEYDVNILEVSKKDTVDNKGIVLEITDKRLIDKTGGIVQGMSGSPIIQNGKLVGAVTHVFVNDPTRGYGVFIENMLNSA